MCTHVHLERYVLWGVSSCDNGGWAVPHSAICKPETQESWWCNLRARELDSWVCRFQSRSESLRTGEDPCLSSNSQAESQFIFPLPFCSFETLSGLDGDHQHWRGPPALFIAPIQMLISSRNPHRHIQKYCSTSCLGIPRMVSRVHT